MMGSDTGEVRKFRVVLGVYTVLVVTRIMLLRSACFLAMRHQESLKIATVESSRCISLHIQLSVRRNLCSRLNSAGASIASSFPFTSSLSVFDNVLAIFSRSSFRSCTIFPIVAYTLSRTRFCTLPVSCDHKKTV